MVSDLQKVADSISAMTCVISVEKLPDNSCGEIRIVTGNKSYIDSIENPPSRMKMLHTKFVPNSPYTRYLNRDLNFEDYCYRAAVEKKCLHSYAHPDRYDVWFDMTFLPLEPHNGNLYYCTYTMEISSKPNSERLSNISGDLAAAVLRSAISLRGASDFRAALKDSVTEIQKMCHSESCCILLLKEKQGSYEILSHSLSEKSQIRLNEDSADFYTVVRTWRDTISGSNCLIAKDEREMKVVAERNPVWYHSLRASGVNTIALFPLKSREDLFGYIWVSNFDKDQSPRVKEILELTSFLLGSEIGSFVMMQRLKELSSKDMLTGVMNRNEMNNYVDQLSTLPASQARSAGVLFADLNGLKTVNDTQGHSAGDQLLCNAAHVLCSFFDSRNIFRAGGDEFVVIVPDGRLAELKEKEDALRAAAARYPDLSFAIGCCICEDCRNVRDALKKADALMYEDKRKYHAAAGPSLSDDR